MLLLLCLSILTHRIHAGIDGGCHAIVMYKSELDPVYIFVLETCLLCCAQSCQPSAVCLTRLEPNLSTCGSSAVLD
jgi:hypothetical protein